MATPNGIHSSEPLVKYVGQKLSRVKWRPQPPGAIGASDIFATGSWDDKDSNEVCLWRYPGEDNEAQLLCECSVPGDVTDLRFLDESRLVASFTNGCVSLFKYHSLRKCLDVVHAWKRLHYVSVGESPASALAMCGRVSIISGGEDGRINVVDAGSAKIVRTIDNADNATVTSLACTMLSEVLSTSSSGQLKVWDFKTAGSKPTKTIVLSGEYVSIQSLDRHPHQPHLVTLGRGDGSLCFYDLRHEKKAVQIIQGQTSDVWEVKFHPSQPNHLFSCSEDGSLWHWDATQSSHQPSQISAALPFSPKPLLPSHSTPLTRHIHTAHQPTPEHMSETSPWISGAVPQGKVEIKNYLPDNTLAVNSLDIESNALLCGCDNEALFVIPDLVLR